MYKRLTYILSCALMAGMFGMFLLFASSLIQTGWIKWLTGIAGLILIAISVWKLNLAGNKANDADHWAELQDMQSREIIDCLERQRGWNLNMAKSLTAINNPAWVLRKLSETFPDTERLLSDIDYDTTSGAWRVKSGLYSEGFLSSYGCDTRQCPEGGKLPCHENA